MQDSDTLLELTFFSWLLYSACTSARDLFGDTPLRNFIFYGSDRVILQCIPSRVDLARLDLLPIAIEEDRDKNKLKVSKITPYALPSGNCRYCPFKYAINLNISQTCRLISRIYLPNLVIAREPPCLDCQDLTIRRIIDREFIERSLMLGCPTAIIDRRELTCLKGYIVPSEPLENPKVLGYRLDEGSPKKEKAYAKIDCISVAELLVATLLAKVVLEYRVSKSFKIVKPLKYPNLQPDLIFIEYERGIIAPINIKSMGTELILEKAKASVDAEEALLHLMRNLKDAGIIDQQLRLIDDVYILKVPIIHQKDRLSHFLSCLNTSKLRVQIQKLATSVRNLLETIC